jgi:hypothetical protein
VAWHIENVFFFFNDTATTEIYTSPEEATAVWSRKGTESGIAVSYKTTAGFIAIADVTVPVGISETQLPEITVYPNPTSDVIFVTRDNRDALQITGIEVFDIYGRNVGANLRVRPESHASRVACHEVNISHLTNGVYFLRITTEQGTVMKKVVKQ